MKGLLSPFGTLLLVTASATIVSSSSSTSSATLHACNRGFCFHKKEGPLDPSAHHAAHFNSKTRRKKSASSVIDFCAHGSGNSDVGTVDCELFHILGTEWVDGEFEALECPEGLSCEASVEEDDFHSENATFDEEDLGVIELDDENKSHYRISWKERPKRGTCTDESGYEFHCNLVDILDDGTVLIEDMREGGVFAAQPKSNFSTKKHKKQYEPRTPDVLMVDEDPSEDFRTNIALNMEGI